MKDRRVTTVGKLYLRSCWRWLPMFMAVVVFGSMVIPDAHGARRRKGSRGGLSKEDYKANTMVERGLEFLEQKQEERGIKLIASVPRMFPKSKIRFRAALELGNYYMTKRRYELAIKQFQQIEASEDADQLAQALYRTGICHYQMNGFDKAFVFLRKVTAEYPWSVYANESYFYIGQCHSKLQRWSKAVEAFKMVGTSVPKTDDSNAIAEAGQRLYIKIFDKDLVVLTRNEQDFDVQVKAKSGDQETVSLSVLGRSGESFIGSVNTAVGEPKPGDNVLQLIGGDVATVTYVDDNTAAGKRYQKRLTEVRMVSTASIGFTDGAYREYTKGIFADNDCFLRVKDFDRDISGERDTLKVRVHTSYKVKKEIDANRQGVELEEEEEVRERDHVILTLTETEAHSGVFVGSTVPRIAQGAFDVKTDDAVLSTMQGDDIVMAYEDEAHMLNADPRTVAYSADVLVGQIKDVVVEHREVNSPDLKAEKQLIEARIFLKLASIFKDVGLNKNAYAKADEGLERVGDVIRMSVKASLERELVEKAFNVKWDLLLVKDQLSAAIAVCNTLTRLFPDSTLVDKALLKIGVAKMNSEDVDERRDSVRIFNAVLRLRKSDLKAEAQYLIAQVAEQTAMDQAETRGTKPNLSHAMLAYKKCAETYPESPFAGDSLEKIANFYISSRDYRRAVELMERVFQDYEDANFLDKMLLKWVIASYRMKNYQVASQKLEQLLTEYPNSPYATKAKKFQKVIEKKLKQGAPAPADKK